MFEKKKKKIPFILKIARTSANFSKNNYNNIEKKENKLLKHFIILSFIILTSVQIAMGYVPQKVRLEYDDLLQDAYLQSNNSGNYPPDNSEILHLAQEEDNGTWIPRVYGRINASKIPKNANITRAMMYAYFINESYLLFNEREIRIYRVYANVSWNETNLSNNCGKDEVHMFPNNATNCDLTGYISNTDNLYWASANITNAFKSAYDINKSIVNLAIYETSSGINYITTWRSREKDIVNGTKINYYAPQLWIEYYLNDSKVRDVIKSDKILQDAYLDYDNPGDNPPINNNDLGTSMDMSGYPYRRRSFMRYDVSQLPTDANITDVKYVIFGGRADNPGTQLRVYHMYANVSWNETNLSNNCGTHDGTNATNCNITASSINNLRHYQTWVTFNITNLFIAALNEPDNINRLFNFHMSMDYYGGCTNCKWDFVSREGTKEKTWYIDVEYFVGPNITNVTINPSNIYFNTSSINCSAIITDENLSVINVTFSWYKNNILNKTSNTTCSNGTICWSPDTITSPFTHFDTWKCQVEASNPVGKTIEFNSITVLNYAPNIPNTYSPNNETIWKYAYLTFNSTDPENDSLIYMIYLNDVNIANTSNQWYNLTGIIDGHYNWSIRAWDGYNESAMSAYRTLYIDNTAPTISETSLTPNNQNVGNQIQINASIIDTSPKITSSVPVLDNHWVQESQGWFDINLYGSYLLIQKYDGSPGIERTYIKMNLTGLDNRKDLNLTFYIEAISNPINLTVYAVTDNSWSENTINWTNQPCGGVIDAPNGTCVSPKYYVDTGLVAGSFFSIPLPDYVKYKDGNNLLTIMIMATNENSSLAQLQISSSRVPNISRRPYVEATTGVTIWATIWSGITTWWTGILNFISNIWTINVTVEQNWTHELNYTIYANDSVNNQASATNPFQINHAPTIDQTIPNTTMSHKYNYTMDVNCSDIDGDILTYYINSSQFTINSSNGIINKTNSMATVGFYSLLVTCSDGQMNATQEFWVNITNTAPTIESVSISPPSAGANTPLTCTGTYIDVDSDPESGSTYRWFQNGDEVIGQTGKTTTITFNENDNMTCEYTPKDGVLFGTSVNSSILTLGPFGPGIFNNNVTLDSDINCSGYPGTNEACLYTNTSDIIIDCSNYTIIGDNYTLSGIFIDIPATNVTIKNCIIKQFQTGIKVTSNNNSLLNNGLYNNTYGLNISGNNSLIDTNIVQNKSLNTGFANQYYRNTFTSIGVNINQKNPNQQYNITLGLYLNGTNCTLNTDGRNVSNVTAFGNLVSINYSQILNHSTHTWQGYCFDGYNNTFNTPQYTYYLINTNPVMQRCEIYGVYGSTVIGFAEASDVDNDTLTYNYMWYSNGVQYVSGIGSNYYCAQESAINKSDIDGGPDGEDCGLNYTGSYGVGGDGNFYINYTKPVNATAALWLVGHGSYRDIYGAFVGGDYITIPSSCFNQPKLQLKVYSYLNYSNLSTFLSYSYPSCYDGTGWRLIGKNLSNNITKMVEFEFYDGMYGNLYDGNPTTQAIWISNNNTWAGLNQSLFMGEIFDELIHWQIKQTYNQSTVHLITEVTNVAKGQTWTLYCQANDTYGLSSFKIDSIIIPNTAPNISAQPTIVNCSVGHCFNITAAGLDYDGVSDFSYANIATSYGTCNRIMTGINGNNYIVTYNCSAGPPQNITNISITFVDKSSYSATTNTVSNMYPNNLPIVLTDPTLTPTPIYKTTALVTCNPGVITDADGDTITNIYKIRVDNGTLPVDYVTQNITNATFEKHYNITCIFYGTDSYAYPLEYSNQRNSTTYEVQNSPPIIGNVDIIPTDILINTTMICNVSNVSDADGDSLTFEYYWSNNTANITNWTSSNTLVCNAGNGCYKGTSITCTARAYDSENYSNPITSSVNIVGNSPPYITQNQIFWDYTNAHAYYWNASGDDPDGITDIKNCTIYFWRGNNTPGSYVITANNGICSGTINYTLSDGNGQLGVLSNVSSYITFTDTGGKTANTSIDWHIIPNHLPYTNVPILSPIPAYKTTSNITCINSTSFDPDEDSVTYAYLWYKNGISTGITTNYITNSSYNHFDNLTCYIYPYDGYGYGTTNQSAVLMISNSPPTQPNLIFPYNNFTINQQIINFQYISSDADSDIINYTIYIDDSPIITTNNTIQPIIIPEGKHNWSVIAYDGYNYSIMSETRDFIIDLHVPIILILNPPDKFNTTDNTPSITIYAADALTPPINYTILINGTPNGQSGQLANGTNVTFDISPALPDGTNLISAFGSDQVGNNNTASIIVNIYTYCLNISTLYNSTTGPCTYENQQWTIFNPTPEFKSCCDAGVNQTDCSMPEPMWSGCTYCSDGICGPMVAGGAGLARFIGYIKYPLFILFILFIIVGLIYIIGHTIAQRIEEG